MTLAAPEGDCFGRAPPSLRNPPPFTAIHLSERTYRMFWTQLRHPRSPCATLQSRFDIAKQKIQVELTVLG